jgi:hypothetical protein
MVFARGRIQARNRSPKEDLMPKPTKASSREQSELQTAEGHPTREEIEQLAYEIYVKRGDAEGSDVEDWLEAERELLVKYGKTVSITKAAAS